MRFAIRRVAHASRNLFTIALLAACTSGDGGPSVPLVPAISIAVVPATLDVTQGGTATSVVTLTRSGGFNEAVTIAAQGLPAGVTIPNITIAAGANSGTLNISATTAATVATTNLTIRGTGTGVTAATAALALNVKAPGTTPQGFTLALSSTTSSVQAGGSATVTVNITRTGGFTGPVALSLTGAPAGLTGAFAPASVTANSSTLTLSALAATLAGTYPLTVRGTATGLSDQTATLSTQVTAAGVVPGTGSAKWTFCGLSGLPLWFAVQDGQGAWTRVIGSNNVYSFNITTRGGVAYVVPMANGGFDLEVFHGTKAEIEARGTELCHGATGTGVTLNGTVAGAGATDLLLIGMAYAIGTAASSNTTFSIPNVPVGSFDLIAGKSALTITGSGVSFTPNKFFIRRNVNTGAATAIDFNGADAMDPVTRSLTINNVGSEQTRMLMSYFTANSFGSFYVDAIPTGGANRTYFGVPAAKQQGTDFHYLNVISTPSGVLQPLETRNAGIAFNAATERTVTLGPSLTAPVMSSPGTGRARAVYTVQSQYNKLLIADFQQTTGQIRKASIQMTGAYNQGAATATLEVPDLSGVAGFDALWLLRTGVAATWTFVATGWEMAGGVIQNPIAEGSVYVSATRMGTTTP